MPNASSVPMTFYRSFCSRWKCHVPVKMQYVILIGVCFKLVSNPSHRSQTWMMGSATATEINKKKIGSTLREDRKFLIKSRWLAYAAAERFARWKIAEIICFGDVKSSEARIETGIACHPAQNAQTLNAFYPAPFRYNCISDETWW